MLYYKEKNGGIKMAYQIYCGKGFDTQKAERFFKERRVAYQRVDVLKYGIGRRELESVAAAVGLDALCDKESCPSSATAAAPPSDTARKSGKNG